MRRGIAVLLSALAAWMICCAPAGAEETLRGYDKNEGYVYLTLGQYVQKADGTVEPILWRVLETDGEKAYLLSEYVLFARPLHITPNTYESDKSKENHTRNEYRDELKGDFAQTDLCRYLNTEFAETAFTAEEMEMLLPCENFGKVFLITKDDKKNTAYGLGSTNPGTTNQKKILANPGCRAWGTEWALRDNGFPESEYPDPKARVVGRAGEHVAVHEVRLYAFQAKYGGCSPWWTRTQSTSDGRHAVATKDGGQIGHMEVARDNIGVRPAVYLAMDAFEITGGAGTMENPWTVGLKDGAGE